MNISGLSSTAKSRGLHCITIYQSAARAKQLHYNTLFRSCSLWTQSFKCHSLRNEIHNGLPRGLFTLPETVRRSWWQVCLPVYNQKTKTEERMCDGRNQNKQRSVWRGRKERKMKRTIDQGTLRPFEVSRYQLQCRCLLFKSVFFLAVSTLPLFLCSHSKTNKSLLLNISTTTETPSADMTQRQTSESKALIAFICYSINL